MSALGQPEAGAMAPGDWVAHTVPLSDAPDLLAVAGDRGLLWRDEHGGIAAAGEAFRLDFPAGLADGSAVCQAGEALRALAVKDEVGLPGCGPTSIGFPMTF